MENRIQMEQIICLLLIVLRILLKILILPLEETIQIVLIMDMEIGNLHLLTFLFN
jgi:hypothetical protein